MPCRTAAMVVDLWVVDWACSCRQPEPRISECGLGELESQAALLCVARNPNHGRGNRGVAKPCDTASRFRALLEPNSKAFVVTQSKTTAKLFLFGPGRISLFGNECLAPSSLESLLHK